MIRFKSSYIAICIACITFTIFMTGASNEFINWDDDQYITNNPIIQTITPNNIKEMFGIIQYWMPLTWLSHAFDYYLYGENAFGHHVTNIILHTISSLLVFGLFLTFFRHEKKNTLNSQITLSLIGIFTLLWAIHPLRVESVSWAAERKDVLCICFMLASILCFLRYIHESNKLKWYSLALLWALLGLASKPLATILPLLYMILISYYATKGSLFRIKQYVSTLPFFGLSLATGIMAIIGQYETKSLASTSALSIAERVYNVIYNLAYYPTKFFFPTRLMADYPRIQFDMGTIELWLAIVLLSIIAVTIYLLKAYRKQLITLCLLYSTSLLPVLGFMPTGGPLQADRWNYLPSVWISILCCGIAIQLSQKYGSKVKFQSLIIGIPTLFIAVLIPITITQIQTWKDSETFWNHCIRLYPNKADSGYTNLAILEIERGQLKSGTELLKKALSINPGSSKAYTNVGVIYLKKNDPKKAIPYFNRAITLMPNLPLNYINRAMAYETLEQIPEAIADYDIALTLDPYEKIGYKNLFLLYHNIGDIHKSKAIITQSKTYFPKHAFPYQNAALFHVSQGNIENALTEIHIAHELEPNNADIQANMGKLYAYNNEFESAIHYLGLAYELSYNPSFALSKGLALEKLNKIEEAFEWYTHIIQVHPNYYEAYYYRGILQIITNNIEQGIADCNEALNINPYAIDIHQLLQEIYTSLENTEKANYHIKKITELKSK